MKKILYLIMLLPSVLYAQEKGKYDLVASHAFQHMEIGATAGTPGVGIDVAMPLNKNLKLRAGFGFMPEIGDVMGFTMQSVGGKYVESSTASKTERLASILSDMIGNEHIDDVVDMERKVSYYNAKVILDWYPFRNKHWHFSGGFYLGSKRIGKVHNTLAEGPTTTAIVMYNQMYDQIQGLDKYEYPVITVGNHSYELDPIAGKEVKEAFNHYGRIAVQLGKYPDGTPFYTEPDDNSIIKAEAIVNAFKPYVGVGYETRLGKEQRWTFGVDAGVMCWGTPHIYSSGYKYHADAETYEEKIEAIDQVCLVHDLVDTSGTVGRYINLIKKLPVLPVLEVKLTYNIW